ncbi:MAG: hypothetical protein WDN76_07310 [Alphaproteobacteria bacterium]
MRDKGHTALGPLFYAAKQIAIATGKALWIGLKYSGVFLLVLFREIRVFAGWAAGRILKKS